MVVSNGRFNWRIEMVDSDDGLIVGFIWRIQQVDSNSGFKW